MKTNYEKMMKEYPRLFENGENAQIRILTDAEERNGVEAETGRTVGIVYEDDYMYILRDAVVFPSGTRGTYIRLFHKGMHGGTVVLPVTEEGDIVLIRHFRHATRTYHYELPRGMYEKGYTPEENAVKELKEETNAVPLKLTFLGEVYPDSGLLGHKVAYYHAVISKDQLMIKDVDEGITDMVFLTYTELKEKILSGEIEDGFTLNALYLAGLRNLI